MQYEISINKAIEKIRNEDIERLSDPDYLELRLLPELGLNDRYINQYPSNLHPYCGTGLKSWQYPNQFAHYLSFLSKEKITSYCEIGCHKGGTFIITVEYLNRFCKLEKSLAIDNWRRDCMEEYAKENENVEYVVCDSNDDTFVNKFKSSKWCLTLIDGDHSYNSVKEDFILVSKHSRIVGLHDIHSMLCPGVHQLWRDVLEQNAYSQIREWTDQYDETLLKLRGSTMGIGILLQ
jgi:hypothetical protein